MALRDMRTGSNIGGTAANVLSMVSTLQGLKRGKAEDLRAQEAFELNKKLTEQRLKAEVQAEKDRQFDRELDRKQSLWEMAHKVGNQEAKDRLREEISEMAGFRITADDEELGILLADRRAAVKSGDNEEVERIDDYLLSVRSITAEQAAIQTGIQTEVAALGAERKLGEELTAKEAGFQQTQKQKETRQSTIAAALKGVEGVSESDATAMSLAATGDITPTALASIMKEKNVVYRAGMMGTGKFKGQSVTKVLDESGNPVLDKNGEEIQYVEAADKLKPKTTFKKTVDPLTLQENVELITEVLDAQGNVIGYKTLPEIVDGKAVEKEPQAQIDIKENFSFEEYVAMLPGGGDKDPAILRSAYTKLVAAGLLKRPPPAPSDEEIQMKKEAQRKEEEENPSVLTNPEAAGKKAGKQAREAFKSLPSPKKIAKDVAKAFKGFIK